MEFIIESNRIYTTDEKGTIIAEITYPNLSDEKVVIKSTFVDNSLRGQGVAAKLTEMAYQEIKKHNKQAKVSCSYAAKWFAENPEYQDILVK